MLMTSDDASGDASHDLPYWVSGHVTLCHVILTRTRDFTLSKNKRKTKKRLVNDDISIF